MSKEGINNYCKLQVCLTETAKLLRKLFKIRWKELFQKTWNDNKKDALFFKKDEIGKKIKIQFQTRQNQVSFETGNSKEWDLSMLVTILLSKPFLTINTKRHIEKLRDIQNKFLELSDMDLSNEVFEELFESIQRLLKVLGCEEFILNSLKNKLIDQTQRKLFSKANSELKNLILFADDELLNKHYLEASKLYSTIINSFEHSNDELGDLYFKRSLTNLHIYEESIEKNEKYLYRSLADAEKVINYRPYLTKGYVQAAEVYLKLNELTRSEQFFKIAFVIESNNMDIKNALDMVRVKIGEQRRNEHLDIKLLPSTTEESHRKLLKSIEEYKSLSYDDKEMDKLIKLLIKADPSKSDVFLGHEYRDGSKKLKQNYDLAARCYAKAANKNNSEALYNLALFHIKGLGVKFDLQMAIVMLKQAVTQPEKVSFGANKIPNIGVKESEHALGLVYEKGVFVEQNKINAVYWYERAVKHDNELSGKNLGIMYQNGDSVNKNYEIAEELFLMAHKLGNNNVMTNLVEVYLLKNDPNQALIWQTKALESNLALAVSNNEEIMEKIQSQKELNKLLENRVMISEEESNNLKEIMSLETLRTEKKITPFGTLTGKYKFNPEMLKEYAFNKSSDTAAKMFKAQTLFFEAVSMIDTEEFSSNMDKFTSLLSKAYQIEPLVCSMPVNLNDKVINIVQNFLKKNKNNDLDCHARICLMYLYINNMDFVNSSILKHPNSKPMYQLRGCLYELEMKWHEALVDFETALKLDFLCCESLFHKSNVLFNMERWKESIESFRKFISVAPNDHRKLPQAYYLMALATLDHSLDISEVQDFFNLGIISEKDQLPCFLPYESTQKEHLILILKTPFMTQKKKKTNDQTMLLSENEERQKREEIANDKKRTSLILEHREYLKGLYNNIQKPNSKLKSTTKTPIRKQALNSIVGLKPIFLRDIDFTKDHTLKNSVLHLKSLEMPTINSFTTLIAVDDNNQAERIAIYNLKEDSEKIGQMFKVGSRFSIVDPCVRIAADGKLNGAFEMLNVPENLTLS